MSIPTLGYPSRTAMVAGELRRGARPEEIAERAGLPLKTVRVLRSMLKRRSYRRMPPVGAANRLLVYLDRQVVGGLTPHAARRGMRSTELVRCLLATVLEENLVDAILDDDDGEERP